MPITESWNNSSDCFELVVTPPFSEEEITKAGFPPESNYIIRDNSNYLSRVRKAFSSYRKISTFINDAIRSESYALVREAPEEEENRDKRYFLSFGVSHEKGWTEYSVSIQLGSNNPDWDSLKEKKVLSLESRLLILLTRFRGSF